jgi:hypothetical protein
MTRREEPSRESLARALQKRVASVEARGLSARSGTRMGHAAQGMSSTAAVSNAVEPVSNKSKLATSVGNVVAAFTGYEQSDLLR